MSSVIQRCACEWSRGDHTVTHTPLHKPSPSPLTLFVSYVFRNDWRVPTEQRGDASVVCLGDCLGQRKPPPKQPSICKVPSTLHPYSTLSHRLISFPALSFSFQTSPWNAPHYDWYILCQSVIGSAEIIKAATEGRLDEVTKWLDTNPQLVNATDHVRPLHAHSLRCCVCQCDSSTNNISLGANNSLCNIKVDINLTECTNSHT